MAEENKQFKSSIETPGNTLAKVKESHLSIPTWGILIFLFIVFFILKSFIYIKDEKRHGK